MSLTSKQRAALRGAANTMDPVYQIGKGEIDETLILSLIHIWQRERDRRLEKRERAQPIPHRRGKYRAGTRGPGPGTVSYTHLDVYKRQVRKSAKGRVYYGCSNYPKCNYMTWDEPVPEKCPQCGSTLFKKKGQLYLSLIHI